MATNTGQKWDDNCPEGCEDPTLPPTSVEDCIQAEEENLSEIQAIYITDLSSDITFTDWTQPGEWAALINNETSEPGFIRCLCGIGDIPAGTPTILQKSKGRSKRTKTAKVLNFDVDNTNDINYEFMRGLQCGGTYCMWIETRGCKLLGGSRGILVSVEAADPIYNRGNDSYEIFQFQFTWDEKISPPRTTSPVA